jgi:Zn finger protein HypA/HybF involved in hydrogenase expression
MRTVHLVVGISAILGLSGVAFYLTGPRGRPYAYMHCPRCGRETTYDAAVVNKPCRHCGQQVPFLVPTVSKGGAGEGGWARAVPIGLVASIALMLLLLYEVSRAKGTKSEIEEVYYKFPCLACGRRLRVPAGMAGSLGKCPRCKTAMVFPEAVGGV